MKRFSTAVLIVVSLSFAALRLAHAQAPADARSECMKKCTDTFQSCMKGALTPSAKTACRNTIKTCALACPKKS